MWRRYSVTAPVILCKIKQKQNKTTVNVSLIAHCYTKVVTCGAPISDAFTKACLIGGYIMWDYSFEVPLLFIFAIILAFFFSRPRLSLRHSRIFLWMIMIETFTIIMDLCASHVDNLYADYDITLIKVLNMLYFIAFFVRSYVLYLFAASVMKDTLERNAVLRHFIRLPMCVGVILSIVSALSGSAEFPHLIFYIDESGYHSGTLYSLLYAFGFYYVILAFISLFLYRNRLGRRREKFSMLFYNVILLFAMAVRLAFPQYLVMDTMIFTAILVVFLAFENPEYFLELKGVTFNRLAFSELLEENINSINRIPYGVVIYNFFEMRDLYGHAQMEAGLVVIARFLKQLFPKDNLFYCRNGRFSILVNPGTNLKEKTEEIIERFKKPWQTETIELYLSAGIAFFGETQEKHDAEILISGMLKGLDSVGKSGNVSKFTEEILEQTEKEKYIRNCIEAALETGGLELYLQPIVNASTNKTVGAEALSRIRDFEGNIIPPGIFIPIAETSGRINELGELVFEKACRFMAKEDTEKMGIEWINVNLSPAQFVRTDLAERYSTIVKRYGIDPSKVHLEITEGAMIDENFLQKQMGTMTECGFKFVLDDYGTGYSNLSRLKKCPFINIKIDMSIVWDYCKEPEDILPNMIQAFKYMGFNITAEGIENEEMVKIMTDIGCDYLQGYCYSKPVPEEEFVKMCMDKTV